MSLEAMLDLHLSRIADALEVIADSMRRPTAPPAKEPVTITVEPGPFGPDQEPVHELARWTASTPPPAIRGRDKQPKPLVIVQGAQRTTRQRGAEPGNTRAGQCGRCKRDGRRRLNFKAFCVDCEHEPWWDE